MFSFFLIYLSILGGPSTIFVNCLNDSSGPDSNKILFTLEELFYVENLSESVHIPDCSNTMKSDVDSDVNFALNSKNIVSKKNCTIEKINAVLSI